MSSTPSIPVTVTEDIAVYAHDEPGPGNAHHQYSVTVFGPPKAMMDEGNVPYIRRLATLCTEIRFQQGGLAEVGANGITNEALLEIVAHRLACFQAGPFACRENDSALNHIQHAIDWLARRTAKRQRRGVEGKAVK